MERRRPGGPHSAHGCGFVESLLNLTPYLGLTLPGTRYNIHVMYGVSLRTNGWPQNLNDRIWD
jgi:hypothetical protein